MQYKDHILSSPQEILRRSGVSKVFGPTYPGDELRYPGLWFSFDEDGLGEGLKIPHAGDRMQEVRRIVISQIDPGGKIYDALDEVNECAAMAGELARAVVRVSLIIRIYCYPHRFQVHDGATLYFHPIATSKPLHIRIGETTAQDLTLDLGPPLRVHYKDDERMKIHAAVKTTEPDSETGCTAQLLYLLPLSHRPLDFYNYFQYGMDFLMSEMTHVVKKIILHTNVVSLVLFLSKG